MKVLSFDTCGFGAIGNIIAIKKTEKENIYEVTAKTNDFGCYWTREIEMTEEEFKVIKDLEKLCRKQ